ncbi:MAG: histidine kinase N-terminal 7TM domain-containing protein, partial [Patescibacteria group bacterium]
MLLIGTSLDKIDLVLAKSYTIAVAIIKAVLSILHMTIPQILPLISALFVLSLGIFVVTKNIRSKSNILFGFFCFGLDFWLFGTFLMLSSQNENSAIFWDRFIYIGGILSPILVYHFGRVFLEKEKKQRWILWLGYILTITFLVASRTNYFVADLYSYSWGVHTKAQILHHIFLVYFSVYIVMFLKDIYIGIHKSTGIRKIQLRYIFVALVVMIIIGSPAYLPAYGISIYPITYLSGVVFAGIVVFAITRYRLMNIRIFISKSITYSILIVVILGIAALFVF